ncbi:TPA: TraR/DksA family transcriptional regulator [Escherichia coli]|nr:TraR/DksA family transcriptional regulator [Escherichia coli]
MADIIDSASEIEELQRNTAIKMRRLNYLVVSATHCCECGDPIDERRRLAVQGCRNCASCQQDLELIRKQRGIK